MSRNQLLRSSRTIHLYFGLFISPALLFFAFTGALQTFSLHETTQGSDYKPPRWAVVLGQIHKKQTSIVPVRKARPAERPQAPAASPATPGAPDRTRTEHGPDGMRPEVADSHRSGQALASGAAPASPKDAAPSGPPKQKRHLPLKIFFLIVSVGLFTSTLTGVYMSYKYTRNKVAVTLILVAGTVLPLLLLPF